MAQRSTHKGPRAQVSAPVTAVVYASIQKLAEIHATGFSQAAADLLALATGHPDLVRVIHQGALLPDAVTGDIISVPAETHLVGPRVPLAAYEDIKHLAADNNVSAGQIAADLLALATGHPGQVRVLNTATNAEVLPLAM